jgi:enoyl-CoA hydratase/carnithine racemase
MSEYIRSSTHDGILQLQIDRPQKKNALTADMYGRLADEFLRAAGEPSARVILLEGSDEIFTAGNDLRDFAGALGPGSDKPPVIRWIEAVATSPLPLVASVRGPAIGIGATILLHFDLVYADETAYFQMPFTDLATVPEAGATYLLPRRYGPQKAAELVLLSDRMSAARAKEIGFVNDVITDGDVREHGRAIARKLAAKPPEAMRKTKALLRGDVEPLLAQIEKEARLFAECLQSEEMQKVIAAKLAG